MIAHIRGSIHFSDGKEIIISTENGVGYQVYYAQILPEGTKTSLYISPVIKETSHDLYGFKTLKDKKLFELLITVKGCGPKSAYALMCALDFSSILMAIINDNKEILIKVKGLGPKAAAQMILDLKNKIHKIEMYSGTHYSDSLAIPLVNSPLEIKDEQKSTMLTDALLACEQLGFSEEKVLPIIQKLISENQLSRSEQLVHLVLKEV